MKDSDTTFTIYLLTNKSNGMVYVGQTKQANLKKRMGPSGDAYANSTRLYAAIKEFGVDNFEYSVLDTVKGLSNADKIESENILKHNSKDPLVGYNVRDGGSNGSHHESTKQQISQTLTEKFASMTQEERNKKAEGISTYWLGKERGPKTEEWKEGNSVFMTEWHAENNHPMKGKHHTEEARALISIANTGRVIDPEIVKARNKKNERNHDKEPGILKAYKEGKIISEIEKTFDIGRSAIYRILNRNNIERGKRPQGHQVGVKASEETRAKQSASATKLWEERNQYEKIEKFVIAAYKEGNTIDDMCSDFDIPISGVYLILAKNNIPKR